jgi:hypothetical protein
MKSFLKALPFDVNHKEINDTKLRHFNVDLYMQITNVGSIICVLINFLTFESCLLNS